MRNMRITTAELAKICGVSQGTVDRALNNRKGIKEETRQKIIAAAVEYGYRDSIEYAKKQIGIIVFNLKNEYFSKLITDIEYNLREIGYSAVVMFTHYNKQYEIECIRHMYNMGMDGIILCPVNSGWEFDNYLKSLKNMPVVTVGNNISSVTYVGIDDFAAMKELTEDIMTEDYDNIIYFSPAIQYSNAYAQKKRFEGFISAVTKPYSVITDIDDIKSEYSEKTVIICSTDYYAMKVYFKTSGVKITGFDNIKALDEYKLPIDSISYSTSEIAGKALEVILKNKQEGFVIEYSLVKRIEC